MFDGGRDLIINLITFDLICYFLQSKTKKNLRVTCGPRKF